MRWCLCVGVYCFMRGYALRSERLGTWGKGTMLGWGGCGGRGSMSIVHMQCFKTSLNKFLNSQVVRGRGERERGGLSYIQW